MRVAIVHYWLLGARGGERVVEGICRLFPEADIYTLFYDPEAVSPLIRSRNVHASFLDPLRRWYRSLLPFMPMAIESFDLRAYDLVISSESGPAKGVITSSTTAHLCYCHTPMRYLWELYPAYMNDFGGRGLRRLLMAPVAQYLRMWDLSTASRVDRFIANSNNVKQRIWRTYRRRARIIYPPVAVRDFYWRPSEGYFLIVSEMVAYKRLDYAIRHFARSGRKLKVVGDGPEYKSLRALATPSIEFCGRVSDADLRQIYARAAALIMPGEEDFGMTMVESLASGKPVIGLGRGGAVEIVGPECGVLYESATDVSLERALRQFSVQEVSFDSIQLQTRAASFSDAEFEGKFLRAVHSVTSSRADPTHTRRELACVSDGTEHNASLHLTDRISPSVYKMHTS